MTLLTALVGPAALAQSDGGGVAEYEGIPLPDGRTFQYAIVRPRDFEADRSYPVLLALPPGRQNADMVEASLRRYWGHQAAERGWVVVSPIAPGPLFVDGGEAYLPRLLDRIEKRIRIEGGRFHLAGTSNGGRSAFRVATLHPERFASVTVLPGYPTADEDWARLANLRGMVVSMFVGGEDGAWVDQGRRARDELAALGVEVRFEVFPGEGHVPPSLDGGVVMDHLETVRAKVNAAAERRAAVDAVLDALHDAASRADGARYFSLFAPNAVFLGTDPAERWTLEEFRAYGQERFDTGTGWTYVKRERHLAFDEDASTAWFDEVLENEKYGLCRGSGVLVRHDDHWRIAQYSLTFLVPNELAIDVTKLIREARP